MTYPDFRDKIQDIIKIGLFDHLLQSTFITQGVAIFVIFLHRKMDTVQLV